MNYSGTGFDVGLDPTFMLAYDLANLTTQLLKVSRRSIRLIFINKMGAHALLFSSLAAQQFLD